ncbi:hypothetical protein EZS27_032539 [termite gut metagenome]|uniref:DUF4435 domain-containing protein n=1 Tax=termite gut metagenome TaxID=433724 RepID=A0A5J4Q885_9ZZZZ
MKVKEKFNKKLLVEGNDDKHVMWALCAKYLIPETFDIIDCEGIDKLYENIPVRFKESGINTIGIIIDADTDINARWNSLKAILRKISFDVPNEFPPTGLILENETYKVGVWIMPNNNSNGMLEDFISFLIPPEDKLLPIVHSTLSEIEKKGLSNYSPAHKSKAIIHSWLAWQKDPGTPLGSSITKKYVTTDEVTCSKLIHWLRMLF